MKTSTKLAIAGGVYLIAVASTVAIQHSQLRPDKPKKISEDVLYFPDDKIITYGTAGLKSVVADIVWIYTINFSARTF